MDLMVDLVNTLNIYLIKKDNNYKENKIKYGYLIMYKVKQDQHLLYYKDYDHINLITFKFNKKFTVYYLIFLDNIFSQDNF